MNDDVAQPDHEPSRGDQPQYGQAWPYARAPYPDAAAPAYSTSPYPASLFSTSAYPASSYPTSPYAGGPYGGYPYSGGFPPYAAAPDPAAPKRRRRIRAAAGAGAAVAVACVAAVAITEATGATSGSGIALPSVNQQQFSPPNNPYGNYPFPNAGSGNAGGGSGNGSGSGSGSGSTSGSTSTATAAESRGVVDINTVLGYQGARAAGTGMIVTANGEILTNNHVVDGATSIKVTVVSTGQTYAATVVGTDPSDDVAVVQLSGASGLATANFGDSGTVKVGDKVSGVGNAGGTGGTPSKASGTVTALNQTITASEDGGGNAETVHDLIESDAPIQAGDSGGPLYDSSDRIVGMDTAAETARSGATVAAYSIAIDKALDLARQIEAGNASSTIHIGSSGFLGVSVEDSANGVVVAGVVTNGPAANAGVVAGDVISAVNGTSVSTSAALHALMLKTKPGQSVRLSWTDSAGQSHSATLTLVAGPAD